MALCLNVYCGNELSNIGLESAEATIDANDQVMFEFSCPNCGQHYTAYIPFRKFNLRAVAPKAKTANGQHRRQ